MARYVKSGSNKSVTFLLVCRNLPGKGKFNNDYFFTLVLQWEVYDEEYWKLSSVIIIMCGNYAGGVLLRPALCSCQFVQEHTEREQCTGGRDICELIASISGASVTGTLGVIRSSL